MMTTTSQRIEAFVLRFVFDGNPPPDEGAPGKHPPAGWRGVIIHVQDQTEKPFTDFADAVAFIARDVRIGDFVFQPDRSNAPSE